MIRIMEENEIYKRKEIIAHNEATFPFSIYNCEIPKLFVEVSTHWHDEMEIIYIRKGSGIVTVDLESMVLQAPAAVFILPGQMHSIRQHAGHTMEYINIIFDPKILSSGNSNLFDQQYLDPLFRGQIRIPSFLVKEMECFDELIQLLQFFDAKLEKVPGYPLLFLSQLYLLCYKLQQWFPYNNELAVKREALDRIKPVLSFVHQNYTEPIRICDAAARIDFSEGHFMRFFKEIMGVSFVTYLKDYRLTKAEEMIRNTNFSILEIAQENGFQNFSYFIRAFKDKYKKTPLKYREQW